MKNEDVFKMLETVIDMSSDTRHTEEGIFEILTEHGLDTEYMDWRENSDLQIAKNICSKLTRNELRTIIKWAEDRCVFDMFDEYV